LKLSIFAVLALVLLVLSSVLGCGSHTPEVRVTPMPTLTPTPTPTPTPMSTPYSCHADFFAEPTECDEPTLVQFTDHSTGEITGWAWDFDGDGDIDSTEQNPSHYYDENGRYSVTLSITGTSCEDTLTKEDYINVTGCKT